MAAADPAVACLSVAFHGTEPGVAKAFISWVGCLGDEHALKYYEYGNGLAPKSVKDLLEELVSSTTWPVYSPFAKKHYGEGLADGKAEGLADGKAEGLTEGALNGEREALRTVLRARGLRLSKKQRDLVEACTDSSQLTIWVTRAATATNDGDIFD
jgi:hypothetical protein